MGLQMMRGPCCCSPSSSSWMLPGTVSGWSICSESHRALALHFLLKRRDVVRTTAAVLQVMEQKPSGLPKAKVPHFMANAERKALGDVLDRETQFNKIDDAISSWLDRSYKSSNLQYNLMMQNIHALESSLVGEDLMTLEREILLHIEQLGALGSFHASMSKASLTHSPHELDFTLPGNITEFDSETSVNEQIDQVIVRSGKSQERKQKRMRASVKGSKISVKAPLRKSRNPRKSNSSQFIADWKNYPSRRRSIVREQSALLVTIKECANLEKIRENMLKEGQEVTYDRWAKAAGVDEAGLKSRLQGGYSCRERLLVTTEWLVKYIAKSYTGMGTAFEDLLQVATLYF